MPQYRIYAGLGGGFGGANYQETDDFKTKEEAEARAYEIACECYESQQGSGINSWGDFMEEAELDVGFDEDEISDEEYNQAVEAYATDLENDDRESWIDYYVIEEQKGQKRGVEGAEENINIDPEEDS